MDGNFKMVHFIGNSDLAIAVLTKGKLNTGSDSPLFKKKATKAFEVI